MRREESHEKYEMKEAELKLSHERQVRRNPRRLSSSYDEYHQLLYQLKTSTYPQ